MNLILAVTLALLIWAICLMAMFYLAGKLLLWLSGLIKYTVKNTSTLPAVNVYLVCNNKIFTVRGMLENVDSIELHIKSVIPPINQHFVIPRVYISEIKKSDSTLTMKIT